MADTGTFHSGLG